MSWGEAWRLLGELMKDPSSHVAAAVAGWDHPVSREWIVAANTYDAFIQVNSDPKKPKPKLHPRPWDVKPQAVGAGTSMTPAEWREMRERLAEAEAGSTP